MHYRDELNIDGDLDIKHIVLQVFKLGVVLNK